jgi:hypothetical protein
VANEDDWIPLKCIGSYFSERGFEVDDRHFLSLLF